MITQVKTEEEKATFCAVVQAHPATCAQMQMRLAVFGDLQGSGWQFYLAQTMSDTQEAEPDIQGTTSDTHNDISYAAIALRGESATIVGTFDAEEVGSFLRFLGVQTLTTPNAPQEYAQSIPEGYRYCQTLYTYTLVAGQSLAVPPLTGDMADQAEQLHLVREPSVMALLPLLFGDETEQEVQAQYYADNCTVRNLGMAEYWLLQWAHPSGQVEDIFTLSASAVVENCAYLSAGETIECYRGQGVGGHYIARMANEYTAKGKDVCFVCEAERCQFYERLGFANAEPLYQYRCCLDETQPR